MAEAKAAAQAQVEEQVKKTLEVEKAAYMENLTDSIRKERMKAKDQGLMVQLYVSEHEQVDRVGVCVCVLQALNMKFFPFS